MERSCRSAGDALRALDQKGIMEDDFVLVSGDVVANLDLAAVLQEHRLRRAKDNNAIMTMVSKMHSRCYLPFASSGEARLASG